MSIQRKSIGLCIVLSIVTCGIYGLYWLYCMAEDVNLVTARPNGPSGGLVLLLSIVTCNIYALYWFYRAGDDLDRQRVDQIKLSARTPLLVESPGRQGAERAPDSITRYVREAIGVKI